MGDSLDAMKVIQQQAPLVVEHKQEQVQEQQMLLADPAQQQMKEQKTAAPKAKREKKRRKISVFDKKKPQAVTQAAAPLQAEQWKEIHTMQESEVRNNYSDQQMQAAWEALRESCMFDSVKFQGEHDEPAMAAYHDMMRAISAYVQLSPMEAMRAVQSDALQKARTAIDAYQALRGGQQGGSADLDEADQIAGRYKNYFDSKADGNLKPWQQGEGLQVDGISKPPKLKDEQRQEYADRKKDVLFPHEPTVNDIHQRGLGDCYLQGGIASLVLNNPQMLKDGIRDNRDGTVTVRFYKKKEDLSDDEVNQLGKRKEELPDHVPLFVTVTKEVPVDKDSGDDAYSSECLWMQLLQKAYAVSGLRQKEGADPAFLDIAVGRSATFLEHFTGMKSTKVERPRQSGDHLAESWVTEESKKRFVEKMQESGFQVTGNQLKDVCEVFQMFWAETHGVLCKKTVVNRQNNHKKEIEAYRCQSPNYREDFEALRTQPETWQERVRSSMKDVLKSSDNHKMGGKQKRELAGCMGEKFLEMLMEDIENEKLTTFQNKPWSGKYTDFAQKTYEKIKQALENKMPVNTTSRQFQQKGARATGKNGESERDGIVENHAYSVIGVTKKGKHLMVRLRNPWGTGELAYRKLTRADGTKQYQSYQIRAEKKATAEGKATGTYKDQLEGIFDMELNDFLSKVSNIVFTDLNG